MHIFSPSAGRFPRIGTAVHGLTLGTLLALAGCASVPPPDGAMNQAQAQLQAARDAGAADYAPVDLGFAQNKFQLAQAAMASRKYEDAANFAEEARADAELARAKARLGSARAQIQSKVEENSRLRAQLEQPVDDGSQAPAQQPAAPTSIEDMPAPSSSVLSAPLPQSGQDGQGFQSMPDPASDSSQQPGGQP
ncbi:hypothetical protein ASG87_13120 [Frateuria sp. Soil773]|nr:hypothetical protein ASG87_13120 [Frateuria sp. Soil773]